MRQIEVHIDLGGTDRHVGLLRRHAARRTETVTFEYDLDWLAGPGAFSIEPDLAFSRGVFAPARGQAVFGSIGDSAPDTWGRRPMQRAERRRAEQAGRAVRTLSEIDYLMGGYRTRPVWARCALGGWTIRSFRRPGGSACPR